jgi:hypothetical protein
MLRQFRHPYIYQTKLVLLAKGSSILLIIRILNKNHKTYTAIGLLFPMSPKDDESTDDSEKTGITDLLKKFDLNLTGLCPSLSDSSFVC